MTKKVLLLHGWGGSNYPHWQSWLAGEVAKEYGCVYFLKFSDFDTPKYAVWMQELKTALKEFKPDIVLCHSLANTLWFHYCLHNKLEQKLQKLYLVAPPSLDCTIEELSEFFPAKLPTTLNAANALLITSTNDPYLTQDEAQNLQKKLAVKMEVLENAGHINANSDFGEWKWMLQELKKELNS